MEFKFRSVDGRPSASLCYFSDLAFRGYSNNRGNMQNPCDALEAIHLREMEKQRIREEIIADEIARRRILEAEVRRELMVERDMAMRRATGIGLPYEERFPMQPDSRISFMPHFDSRWFEEQRTYPWGCGHGCSHNLSPPPEVPLRLPEPPCYEVKHSSKCNKDKLIMLDRPDPDLAGKKRKIPPESAVHTLPLTSLKKPKEEWSCALCEVSATSEKGLNEHLQGRRHKAKEEKLRAQSMAKNPKNRSFSKKAGKPAHSAKTSVTSGSETERTEKKSSKVNKTRNDSNQKMELKNNVIELQPKKNQGEENFGNKNKEKLAMTPELKNDVKKNKKKRKNYKEKFNFWCEMCSRGAYSELVMGAHIKGKKHRTRLEKLEKNGKALLKPLSTSSAITSVVEETQMTKDENMIDGNANKNAKEDIPDGEGSCSSSLEK